MATETRRTNNGYTRVDWPDFVHTGPGMLAGRYLRLFWHPVYRVEDLAPGWAVPLKIMNEEFTLYRGEGGTPHLLAFRCAHRGTQLSTGWVEDDCLRCRYHGWMYDGSGQCVQAPMEQPSFPARVKIKSYPVQEYLGLIFAYLGEGEPPPLPRYPVLEGEGVLENDLWTRACNYFNELENDPGHGAFVHRDPRLPKGVFYFPELTITENEFGFLWHQKYPDGTVQVSQIGMPNIRHMKVPPRDPESGWRTVMRWIVPIDDEHHAFFVADLAHLTGEAADRYRERRRAWFASGGKLYDPELSDAILAGKLRLEDIDHRTDLDLIQIQDDVTQIGQRRIRDMHEERLGRSDGHVVVLRKLWARELRALAEGHPLTRWRLPEPSVITDGYTRDRPAKGLVYAR